MTDDIENDDWRCLACGYTNPDFDEFCSGCGDGRYGQEEGDDSLSNLYNDETHRMSEAQRMK